MSLNNMLEDNKITFSGLSSLFAINLDLSKNLLASFIFKDKLEWFLNYLNKKFNIDPEIPLKYD